MEEALVAELEAATLAGDESSVWELGEPVAAAMAAQWELEDKRERLVNRYWGRMSIAENKLWRERLSHGRVMWSGRFELSRGLQIQCLVPLCPRIRFRFRVRLFLHNNDGGDFGNALPRCEKERKTKGASGIAPNRLDLDSSRALFKLSMG